ncbi:integrator complex subunit 7-like [Macrosteles quadrilineatus]|uniref:integrator complex subunit 7-like n=1 Tax=Macrosteles quadrilineatus TaxID=74068 RepID=UPI0023E0A180|nr:integrator complex subunit 7-like [Macrosteles quadrilineatus]
MLPVRVSTFSDAGLGEPEQDANSALTELDKGLRSGRVGEQCEAIVRFPRLFEKYPFPILINSSFLKLADVFRVGNNFLRLWVLRVCQQSEKHLDKILNIDEFVRRVFSVIHSNDPVARALTLRTLGSVANIIPERQQVHHSIRRSLDSHDAVEVEAAIYAAMQFAAQSKSFAVSMCNKISHMIQGLATPAHMKLQLIPILQHMHHDTSTAAMVRQLCTDLLPKYPAQDFVVVTLGTLTKLASATLVEIPNQVELLLDYLVNDPRREVQLCVLQCLHQVAQQGAHLWPDTSVASLVNVARGPHPALVSCALDVLIVLTRSAAVCNAHARSDSELMELCQDTSYSSNVVIATKSIKILTQVLCYCFTEELASAGLDERLDAVESLFLLLACTGTEAAAMRSVLRCIVNLCNVQKNLCPRFVQLIATCLVEDTADWCSALLCEALGAIGGMQQHSTEAFLKYFLKKLNQLSSNDNSAQDNTHTKVMLCTLVFQCVSADRWLTLGDQSTIDSVVQSTNLWANYRIARSAARYGHFSVCARIVSQLHEHVSSENFHFWLLTLEEVSAGEASLRGASAVLDRLGAATTHYYKALAAIKAASTPGQSLVFQTEYLRLRCEMLQCLSQLVATCKSFCTAPPPAISATIVQTTRDDLQRFGNITNRLRKCIKEFQTCGELYWKLYQSAFDADISSLNNIQILQHMCALMAHNIECVAVTNHQGDEPALDASLQKSCLETQLMVQCCQRAALTARSIDKSIKPITHLHLECLMKQVEVILEGSLCLPRFFFQVLQSTSVKLAVTPQPRVNGEYLSVAAGSQLAVKVEGVIQHGSRPGHFRSVKGVLLTLSSQLTSRPQATSTDTKSGDGGVVLWQSVTPHRDFFTAQFLLALGAGGQHTVTVEAAVQDDGGNVWTTGPRQTLNVKSTDDASTSRTPRTSF